MRRSRDFAAFGLLVLSIACIACSTTANAKDGPGDGEVRIEYASPERACGPDNPRRPPRKYWCLALRVTNKTSNAFTLVTDPLSSPPKKLLDGYWFQYMRTGSGSEWKDELDSTGVSILEYTRVAPGEAVDVYIYFPGARLPVLANETAARIAVATVEGETFYSDPFPDSMLSKRK